MRCLIGLVLVLIAAAQASAADSEATPPGTVEEILQQQYAALSKIEFGRVVLRVLSSQGKSIAEAEGGPPDPNYFTHFRYDVEFHGERFRVHRVDLHGLHEEQLRIVTPDYVINVRPDHTAIMSHDVAKGVHTHEVFDPRLLCVVSSAVSLLSHHTLEETVLISDIQSAAVDDAVLDGVAVLHISFDRLIGNHIERWIAPSLSYMLLRSRVTDKPFQGRFAVHELRQTVEEFPPGVKFVRSRNSTSIFEGKVFSEEIVEVESADFTIPPAEERFTLAGIGLSPGNTVHQNGKPLVWNGSELFDPLTIKPDVPPRVSSPDSPLRRWLLLANALILAGLAVTLAVRQWQKRGTV